MNLLPAVLRHRPADTLGRLLIGKLVVVAQLSSLSLQLRFQLLERFL